VKDGLSDQQQTATVPTTAKRAASDPATAGNAPVGESHAWEWVDREIWTERMLAALATASKEGKESKESKWFSLIDKVWRDSTLWSAWQQVRAKRGAAGIDRISIARFEANAPKYLSEVAEQLKTGQYRAEAVRRVEIPKAGGGSRPLGIPTVKDRVVQAAVKRVIEPIFESVSATRATGSDRAGAARTHYERSTAGSGKATPTWWTPTSRATSTASHMSDYMRE
jgi:RNA-directed DNA polymerase